MTVLGEGGLAGAPPKTRLWTGNSPADTIVGRAARRRAGRKSMRGNMRRQEDRTRPVLCSGLGLEGA